MRHSSISPALRFRSRYIEALLAAFGFIVLYIPLAYFVPGAVLGSDVPAYMNFGLNGLKSTGSSYNRYFHILLERIFLKIASTPLHGAQLFWAFLITSTCLLIYVSARLFHLGSHPLNGLLAVAVFLSLGVVAESDGTPGVDITAMFIVMVVITVYLLSARVGHCSKWLVSLLGLFFYLALKTKETTLPVGVLVLGLGLAGPKSFDWPAFLKNLLYFFGGFLAGVVVMAIWTWSVVGDPLFGLRPSEFKDYLANYGHLQIGDQAQTGTDNWYTNLFSTTLLFPFILYVVSGLKSSFLPLTRRLVWLIPLLVILFVSLSVGNRWGILPRFIEPALPVICFLGVQFLNFDPLSTRKGWINAVVLLAISLVVVELLRDSISLLIPKAGWDTTVFLNVVFYPFLLSCLLAVSFLVKLPGDKATKILFLLIIARITFPLITNFKALFYDHENQQTEKAIYYPYSTFSKEIIFTPQMHMFISKDIWTAVGEPYSGKNIDEVNDLFNIYFNTSATKDNFSFSNVNAGELEGILNSNYTYLLLTKSDWQQILNDPQVYSLAEQKYLVFSDPKKILFLLKARQAGIAAEGIPALIGMGFFSNLEPGWLASSPNLRLGPNLKMAPLKFVTPEGWVYNAWPQDRENPVGAAQMHKIPTTTDHGAVVASLPQSLPSVITGDNLLACSGRLRYKSIVFSS
jgi:hypothetical protein